MPSLFWRKKGESRARSSVMTQGFDQVFLRLARTVPNQAAPLISPKPSAESGLAVSPCGATARGGIRARITASLPTVITRCPTAVDRAGLLSSNWPLGGRFSRPGNTPLAAATARPSPRRRGGAGAGRCPSAPATAAEPHPPPPLHGAPSASPLRASHARPTPGRAAAGSTGRPARARSPCCQRSGGAVSSRGSLPPPLCPCVLPAGGN